MKNRVKHNLIFALFLTIFAVIFATFALGSNYSSGDFYSTKEVNGTNGAMDSYVVLKTEEEVNAMAINVGGIIDGESVIGVAYSKNANFQSATTYLFESNKFNMYYNAEVFSGESIPAGYFKIYTGSEECINEIGLFNAQGEVVKVKLLGVCDYSTDYRYEISEYALINSGAYALFDSQEGMKVASSRYDTLSEIEIELMSSVNSYLYLDKSYATYEAMPFATLIFSGAIRLFGNSIFALRLINFISYIAFALAFCLILGKVFNRSMIGVIGGVVAMVVGLGFDIATVAGPFKVTYLFVMIGIYYAIKYLNKRAINYISTDLIVSGVMFTISVACSLISLVPLAVLATIITFYIIVRKYKDQAFEENRRYVWHFVNLGISYGLIPVTFMLGIIVFIYNNLIDYAMAMKLFTIVSKEMEHLISIRAVDCLRNAGRLCKAIFNGTMDKCKYLVRVTTSEMFAIFASLIVICSRFCNIVLATFRTWTRAPKDKEGKIIYESYAVEAYSDSGRQKMRRVRLVS